MALTPLRPGQGLYGAAMWMHCNGNGAQFPSDGEGGTTADRTLSIFAPRIANTAAAGAHSNEPLVASSFVYSDTAFTITLAGAFATYEWTPLDVVEITGGTNMTAGFYNVVKRVDDNTILTTNCGTGDSTDATLRLYEKKNQARVFGGGPKITTTVGNIACWFFKGNASTEYECGFAIGNANATVNQITASSNLAGDRGVLLRSGFCCAMTGAADEAVVFFAGVT